VNGLGSGLSLLAAVAAVIAALYWRKAGKVEPTIDAIWLDGWHNIPDSVWTFATPDAVKKSGDLNRNAAYWAVGSAAISIAAALASWWQTSN
jgi:hypothetical protein